VPLARQDMEYGDLDMIHVGGHSLLRASSLASSAPQLDRSAAIGTRAHRPPAPDWLTGLTSVQILCCTAWECQASPVRRHQFARLALAEVQGAAPAWNHWNISLATRAFWVSNAF